MHRRWMSLPLFTGAVSAFYPYHDGGSQEDHIKRFIPLQPFSQEFSGDVVTMDIKKVYFKRDNKFPVVFSNSPSSPNALAVSQDGSDYSYFSIMDFGSSNQEMYMLLDTGSANTWVMGQGCTSKACTIHNLFGPADSTTLNVTTSKWSVAYGTGTVSGVVASDVVKFANFTLNMGFGLATTASDDFNNYPMDGILGLGIATSNELGVPTVMEDLKTQGNLAQNIIGVHLNRASDNTKDGEIMFGGVDTSMFVGELSYTGISNPAAWEIPVDDAFVNDTPCGFSGKSAIIDTGTSYVLMPPSDAQKLHSLIPGSASSGETFTLPCDSTADVQVSFSGVRYSISPKDYVGRTTSGSVCSSNIIGHQAFGPDEWILGDVFLKNVYTVFDFDQSRIGFAILASGTTDGGLTSASSNTTSVSSTTLSTSTTQTNPASSATSLYTSTATSIPKSDPFSNAASSGGMGSATSAGQSFNLPILIIAAFLIGLVL